MPAISFQKYHDIIAYIVAGQIYRIAGVIIMVIPKSLLQSIMAINILEQDTSANAIDTKQTKPFIAD